MAETVYGTASGLEAMWRPLSEQEKTNADTLLQVVSAVFRARVPGLDDLVEAGTVNDTLVGFSAQQVVKRVLMNPEGFKQISDTTGPFSGSATYDQSVAGVNLYVSDGDIKLFLPSHDSSFSIGTIRLRPGLGMA